MWKKVFRTHFGVVILGALLVVQSACLDGAVRLGSGRHSLHELCTVKSEGLERIEEILTVR